MVHPHECKQEQEMLNMARTVKVLFALMTLLIATQGWILYASNANNERVHIVETNQAKLANDMCWIKDTLIEIKTEVKRERK